MVRTSQHQDFHSAIIITRRNGDICKRDVVSDTTFVGRNHLQCLGESLGHEKMLQETDSLIAFRLPSTEGPVVAYSWATDLAMDTPAPQVRRAVRGSSELHAQPPRTLWCVHLAPAHDLPTLGLILPLRTLQVQSSAFPQTKSLSSLSPPLGIFTGWEAICTKMKHSMGRFLARKVGRKACSPKRILSSTRCIENCRRGNLPMHRSKSWSPWLSRM